MRAYAHTQTYVHVFLPAILQTDPWQTNRVKGKLFFLLKKSIASASLSLKIPFKLPTRETEAWQGSVEQHLGSESLANRGGRSGPRKLGSLDVSHLGQLSLKSLE